MEKVTALIKKDVFQEIKQRAKDNERSVCFIVRELINKGLDRDKEDNKWRI